MSAPRHIGSTAPFSSAVVEYRRKGWNVIPIPERSKKVSLTDVTGRNGRFATDDDIQAWLADPQWEKGNIAIRPGNPVIEDGIEYEVIGIDVDDYKGKSGGKHLAELEKTYGPLPSTWTSSARSDGKSGIRWFLTPIGYEYMGKPRLKTGKASDSIEIVQRVHRYGIVFPSWHPDTKGQYYWYGRGQSPDGIHMSPSIPRCTELAVLPDNWFKFLSRGGTEAVGNVPMDMDSEPDELQTWATKEFVDGETMCDMVLKQMNKQCDKIANASDHHDPLVSAHWELYKLGAEGHTGWDGARVVIESAWMDRIGSDGSRRLSEAGREMLRSRIGALRKLKGLYDEYKAQGVRYLVDMDPCDGGPPPPAAPPGTTPPPNVKPLNAFYAGIDPKDYDKNDKGQADHFIARVKDDVHFLADYNAWIIYDGNTWAIDSVDNIKDRFIQACVVTSKRRGKAYRRTANNLLAQQVVAGDPRLIEAKKQATKLEWIAEHYGNDSKIMSALNVAKSIPGVSMQYNQLNWDATVLAMPEGKVLRLEKPSSRPVSDSVGFTLEDNEKTLFTTLSTAVPYVDYKTVPAAERALWKGYLDLFLPAEPGVDEAGKEVQDFSYRRFVQKALGYILIGGNPNKIGIFLVGKRDSGKSTMIKVMQAALGTYATTFQPNSVFKDNQANNPELGNLLHCRGIFSSEAGSQRIYANPFKRNTGGDRISVTRKYANDQIVGMPHFVPVVATNQPPNIEDADEALIKRIMVLQFDNTVDEAHNDRQMDSTIEHNCRHAVFSWLVAGYRAYIREGLDWNTWHPIAQAATRRFAIELNDVSSFINEHCVVADDATRERLAKLPSNEKAVAFHNHWMQVTSKELGDLYQAEFAGDNRALGPRQFIKKMKQLYGLELVWDRAGTEILANRWKGLKWRSEKRLKVSMAQ